MTFEAAERIVAQQDELAPYSYSIEEYDRVLPPGEQFYDMDVIAQAEGLSQEDVVALAMEQGVPLQESMPDLVQTEHAEEAPAEEKHSIFTYFDIDNEVAFAQRQLQKGTTVEGVKMLLSNEVICFLEEFAGKVDTAKITYHWKSGQLYAPGAAEPALQSWITWAEKTNGEREWADAFGFQKIQESFAAEESRVAIQLSPPSIGAEGFGTYGFCNIYINKGDHMDMFLLKYNNEDADLSKSNGMLRELNPEHEATTNAADFLTEPVLFSPDISHRDLAVKLEQLGFGADLNLEEASEFSRVIRKELSGWTDQFNDTILALADAQSNDEYQILYKRAELLLAACYNKARDIKDHLDGKTSAYVTAEEVEESERETHEQNELQRYAQLETAYVVGGGTCPAGSTNEMTQSISELLLETGGAIGYGESLQIYDIHTASKTKEYLPCTCPFCNKKVSAEIDKSAQKISCPKCNKSAPYRC